MFPRMTQLPAGPPSKPPFRSELLVKKHIIKHKAFVAIIVFMIIIAGLAKLDIVPIGYKHVIIRQASPPYQSMQIQQITCPPISQPIIKLHFHVPGERKSYDAPAWTSICPTYSLTNLLYW